MWLYNNLWSAYRNWIQDDFVADTSSVRVQAKTLYLSISRPLRVSQSVLQRLFSTTSYSEELKTAIVPTQFLHKICKNNRGLQLKKQKKSVRDFSRPTLFFVCSVTHQRIIPSPRDEKERRLPHVNIKHTAKLRTTHQTRSLPWATFVGYGWCLQIPLNLGDSPLI